MTAPLYRLGGFCVRHRYLVAPLWLALAATLVVLASSAGPRTSDDVALPGADSQQAADLLAERFPAQANGMVPISFTAPPGTKLTDAAASKSIQTVARAYEDDGAQVSSVISPLEPAGAAQLSGDGRHGYIALQLRAGSGELSEEEAHALVDTARPLAAADLEYAAGGYLGQKVSKAHNGTSELIGLLAAVLILLMSFGTVVAMGLPILAAILGLAIGLAGIGLLGHLVDVPTAAPALATMIGLGVGIDYALFVITRHRQQLDEGMDCDESIARAVATSGGAVVFAGGTVVIALVSLLLAGIPIVTTLGYTAGIVVLIGVLGTIVFLPAVLGIVDLRINSLRLPTARRRRDPGSHGWHRWADGIAARPWPAIVASVAVLAVLTIPIRGLALGQDNVGALPETTNARIAYDQMATGFGVGSNGPILVTVELDDRAEPAPGSTSPASDVRLQNLRASIEKADVVHSVTQPRLDANGTAAVYTVQSTAAPSSEATADLVHRLRASVLPAATGGWATSASVGGITAGYVDLADAIGEKLPVVIATVLALSFLLLVLAFRSVVVPLKAVVMNLVSIGAAFGVVTFVFGHDWSANLIGLEGSQPIVSYVPLMMFAILFGLSMDYEVFLMTHVRERFAITGDPHASVIEGLAGTARVITSAALIMVSVFLAFVLSDDPAIKQFGVGMAAAVAIDATVVRCVLVPAVMSLLGRRAWWMPGWLARIAPEISIEGDEYFREREPAAGKPRGPAPTRDAALTGAAS